VAFQCMWIMVVLVFCMHILPVSVEVSDEHPDAGTVELSTFRMELVWLTLWKSESEPVTSSSAPLKSKCSTNNFLCLFGGSFQGSMICREDGDEPVCTDSTRRCGLVRVFEPAFEP
jgi:hypothetical protein